jgi:hypothetical protein
LCAGDWILIKGGEKYLLELTETSCLIWHKEVTHSSIFSSGLALVSTYRGLQTNKNLECWVPYGLRLHKDWNRVMEDSMNRFRSKMNCKFSWETSAPDEVDARAFAMAIDAFPLTAHEEREMGADMQVACMFVLDLLLQDPATEEVEPHLLGPQSLEGVPSEEVGRGLPHMPGHCWVQVQSR